MHSVIREEVHCGLLADESTALMALKATAQQLPYQAHHRSLTTVQLLWRWSEKLAPPNASVPNLNVHQTKMDESVHRLTFYFRSCLFVPQEFRLLLVYSVQMFVLTFLAPEDIS